MTYCQFCGGFNHEINDCQDPELATLCSVYMTYQYKPTAQFEPFLRALSYQKFLAIAYFCAGYEVEDIHPTKKRDIMNRLIEMHVLSRNTQRLNRMTWRHMETPPVVINSRRDKINQTYLIEGYQIDVIKIMNEIQIKDTLYLMSRGNNLDSMFSPQNSELDSMLISHEPTEEVLREQQSLEELSLDQLLHIYGILWTNRDIEHGTIECPICYLVVANHICQYNCSHTFCRECTCKTLRTGNIACSLCRTPIQNIQHYV